MKKQQIKVSKNKITLVEAINNQLSKDVNNLLDIFYNADPTIGNMIYKRKGQRDAMTRLMKKYGKEEMIFVINKAIEVRNKPFAPIITNPVELEIRLIKLKLYLKRKKNEGKKIMIGTDFSKIN